MCALTPSASDLLGQPLTVRTASQMSGASVASSTISEFLTRKTRLLESQIDCQKAYLAGLIQRGQTGGSDLDADALRAERNRTLDALLGPLIRELKILRKSKRGLLEDIDDEFTNNKWRRAGDEAPSNVELLERAYAAALAPRVRFASAKPKRPNFKHREFRTDVLKYYDALDSQEAHFWLAWCHITGWWNAEAVKVAHLVPQSLTSDELNFLFGTDEDYSIRDPRNGKSIYFPPFEILKNANYIIGLSLHRRIEQGLENGSIAIVPIPSAKDQETRWKCLLVDSSLRDQTWAITTTRDDFKCYKWKVSSGH